MDNINDTSPDELMHHFRGRSLKSIIIFTIIVHFVIIGGTSLPFLVRTFTGPDTEKLSEEERIELALKDAKASVQAIADQYGIRPKEISGLLDGKRPPAAEAETETEEPTVDAEVEAPETLETPAEPEAEKSEIEKQLEVAVPGPELPPVEEAVDLFN